jgi:hypothetical protein
MQDIEPYYSWRHLYIASEDNLSPFYDRSYNEFEYDKQIYNFYIHPQWDDIGSETLFIKILFVSYDAGFAIIELLGEWNDALHNDIMFLKRDVMEVFNAAGIDKFILIGENVLNFHASDDSYYEEWFQDIEEDGWIVALNFQEHVLDEMKHANIDYYLNFGGNLQIPNWRTLKPEMIFFMIEKLIKRRLNP